MSLTVIEVKKAPVAEQSRSPTVLLDAIRYLLAAIVVLGHGFGFFLGYFDGFFPTVFPHPQSIAVVCFFYLSGFLIARSQILRSAKNDATLKMYLFDRVTRVYITLLPSLVFVAMVDLTFKYLFLVNYADLPFLGLKAGQEIETGLFTFICNLFLVPSPPFGTMRPLWSLMYEWWIYLLFGGLYFLKNNRFSATLLILAGAVCTSAISLRLDIHMWVIWALGGGCAYFQNKIPWQRLNSNALRGFALILVTGATWFYCTSKNAYNLPAGILLALALFVFTSKTKLLSSSSIPVKLAMSRLAGLSFTLFLTHYTVLTYTKVWLDGWTGLLAGTVAAHVVAFLIAYVSEYNLQTVKTFLFRKILV